MNEYIPLSTLNDFIFCPYSIYLHSVYMEADGDVYKAVPQTKGTIAHEGVDKKSGSTRKNRLMSMPVCCDELGISGRIDVFDLETRTLVERKNNLKQIFRGQIYQLWGQYFCMEEMGYEVARIAFYEISTNKFFDVQLPGEEGKRELAAFIARFKNYDPASTPFSINTNKCIHCIYCNLCDKTSTDNVYT